MPKLFIHVGLPKTGTSFLQNSFELLEKKALFRTISYPLLEQHDSFLEIHSGNAATIGHYLSPKIAPYFHEDELQKRIDALFDQIKGKKRAVLISSEFFSTAPKDRVTKMIHYLQRKGYDIELIVVVRPLQELIFSAYMQNVKRDGTEILFEDWVGHIAKRLPGFYIKNIMAYTLPVHVLEYNKTDLLDKILRIIGENPVAESILTNSIVNRSLARNELELLRSINSIFKDPALSTKISNRLIESFPNRPSTVMTQSEQQAYKKSISETSPSFNSYTDPTEKKIVDRFLANTPIKTTEVKASLIDKDSLTIALNIINEDRERYKALANSVQKQNEKEIAAVHHILKNHVDNLRELAMKIEKHDIKVALKIMYFALWGRPDGPIILNKVKDYETRITRCKFDEPAKGNSQTISLLRPNIYLFKQIASSLEEHDTEKSQILQKLVKLVEDNT